MRDVGVSAMRALSDQRTTKRVTVYAEGAMCVARACNAHVRVEDEYDVGDASTPCVACVHEAAAARLRVAIRWPVV